MGESGFLTVGLSEGVVLGVVEGVVDGVTDGSTEGSIEGSILGLIEDEVVTLGDTVALLALGSVIFRVVLVISRSALVLMPFTNTWVVSKRLRLADPAVLALTVKVAIVPWPV